MTVAAPAASEAESQDDDWGDFEDATGGEAAGQDKAGPEDAGAGAPTPSAAGEDDVVTVAASDSGAREDGEDEEWGTFADAAALAEGAVVAETGEVGASRTAGSTSNSAGSPEAPEEEVDPFADIAPATPPPVPPRSLSTFGEDATREEQQEESGNSDEGRLGKSSTAAEAATATMSAAVGGFPLSLRGLRDALAKRGRLEEAVEVQQRMELVTNSGEEGEDRDLDRWRAAVDLPPRPTIEELAETVSAADAERGARFRERFVRGRPPVEEEALAAGGGALALATAVKRQRAARRAVYLSSVLGTAAAAAAAAKGVGGDDAAGTQLEEAGVGGRGLGFGAGGEQQQGKEPELDFGLDSGAERSPPALADWALMTAHVTRMAEAGIEALKGGGGGGTGDGGDRAAALTNGPASPRPPPPPSPFSQPSEREGDSANDNASAGDDTVDSGTKERETAIRAEVARSEKFGSFARGLREAVKVCRMLQATAEDGCLEGVDGFASMERAWADLRRCAWEAAGGGGGDDDDFLLVFGPEAEEREAKPGSAGDGNADDDRRNSAAAAATSSVKAMREACVERVPAGSALCAVSLQPLAVFSQGRGGGGGSGGTQSSSLPPGVVEYCGVRYLACAVNLWVNVLENPPPPLAELGQ